MTLAAEYLEEVVVFGPSDMQTAHSSRERRPLGELDAAVGIVEELMAQAD